MTRGVPQQSALASRVARLVERAMAFAIEEHDDDVALARLAWLAQADQAALEEAGEVCLAHTEVNLVVRDRAAALLARLGHHDLPARPLGSPNAGLTRQPGSSRATRGGRPAPPRTRRGPAGMQDQRVVGYGEWSAIQAGMGGRGDLEGATEAMSTEVGDLDAALAALYQLPLEQFVATRDQLARRLRAAGDRVTARQVAGLRRPPVSAWAANQLASAAPNAVAELLEVGAALRQAQQDAVAGQPGAARQLRTATAQLRAAITRLSARAETLLVRAGHAASDATLARLAATLQAAATADAATRAALAQGRLPGDLDPAGFGLDLVAAAGPTASAALVPEAPAPPVDRAATRRAVERARAAAQRAVERTRGAAEQARAGLNQAEGLAASREQAAQAAHQRAEQLTTVARDLADRAAAAATAADAAHQAAEGADRAAEEVADRVRVAQQATEAAEAAHAAAVAALEELEDQT
jgi:methyl-accepting chemotaxis protein